MIIMLPLFQAACPLCPDRTHDGTSDWQYLRLYTVDMFNDLDNQFGTNIFSVIISE